MLAAYINGNCAVKIHEDGTKTRAYEGAPAPEFPESIDLKITDYCDAGCPFCHEKSTKNGKHADLFRLIKIMDGLPPGVEIAIGGGNPMDYPQLQALLQHIRSKGLIANLTVRNKHFIRHARTLCALSDHVLVHGIGVSVDSMDELFFMRQFCQFPAHVVFHLIAGVASPQSVLKNGLGERILVLGFKRYGLGEKYFSKAVEDNLNEWRYWIGTIMKRCESVSFDNLALEQLGIKERVKPQAWAESFMGDDGKFTMYVDGVKNEYAKSSTGERVPMKNLSAREAFKAMHEASK